MSRALLHQLVWRGIALFVLVASGCGDLEADRICITPPCSIPGRSTPDCQTFLVCYSRTGGDVNGLQSTYGNGGTCWTSGAATADSCTSACKSAVRSLKLSTDAGC